MISAFWNMTVTAKAVFIDPTLALFAEFR